MVEAVARALACVSARGGRTTRARVPSPPDARRDAAPASALGVRKARTEMQSAVEGREPDWGGGQGARLRAWPARADARATAPLALALAPTLALTLTLRCARSTSTTMARSTCGSSVSRSRSARRSAPTPALAPALAPDLTPGPTLTLTPARTLTPTPTQGLSESDMKEEIDLAFQRIFAGDEHFTNDQWTQTEIGEADLRSTPAPPPTPAQARPPQIPPTLIRTRTLTHHPGV